MGRAIELAPCARAHRPNNTRRGRRGGGGGHLLDAGVEHASKAGALLRNGERGAVDRPLVEAGVDVGEAVGLAKLCEARIGAFLDPVLQLRGVGHARASLCSVPSYADASTGSASLVGIDVERVDRTVKHRVDGNVVAVARERSEIHLPQKGHSERLGEPCARQAGCVASTCGVSPFCT